MPHHHLQRKENVWKHPWKLVARCTKYAGAGVWEQLHVEVPKISGSLAGEWEVAFLGNSVVIAGIWSDVESCVPGDTIVVKSKYSLDQLAWNQKRREFGKQQTTESLIPQICRSSVNTQSELRVKGESASCDVNSITIISPLAIINIAFRRSFSECQSDTKHKHHGQEFSGLESRPLASSELQPATNEQGWCGSASRASAYLIQKACAFLDPSAEILPAYSFSFNISSGENSAIINPSFYHSRTQGCSSQNLSFIMSVWWTVGARRSRNTGMPSSLYLDIIDFFSQITTEPFNIQ